MARTLNELVLKKSFQAKALLLVNSRQSQCGLPGGPSSPHASSHPRHPLWAGSAKGAPSSRRRQGRPRLISCGRGSGFWAALPPGFCRCPPHAVQGALRHMDRDARLLGHQLVQAPQQRAAAGEDNAVVDNISRKLRRSLFQGALDASMTEASGSASASRISSG